MSVADLFSDVDFALHSRDGLTVHYSPFDHIEASAKLVVVGITPGIAQATTAFNSLYSAKTAGASLEEAMRLAKITASFSGALRTNLISMLDHIGVNAILKCESTSSLFKQSSSDVHFTSALRYPVLVNGRNYSGSPSMMKVPELKRMVETHLAEEAKALSHAIWLPLGPRAEEAVVHLLKLGLLPAENILAGMPHPSGANAERVAVFTGRKCPELASRQTNARALLAASARLIAQVSALRLS